MVAAPERRNGKILNFARSGSGIREFPENCKTASKRDFEL